MNLTESTTRTVDFYFEGKENTYTNESFQYVEKKLVRLINNYETEATIIWTQRSAEHVSAVIIFEYMWSLSKKETRKKIDRDMTRVINSHKGAATFGWETSITTKAVK